MAKTKSKVELAAVQQSVDTFKMIHIDQLMPDHQQPRKFFDETAMEELKSSIRTNGIIQPIMVRDIGSTILGGAFDGKTLYYIVCGERRYRAAEAVGMKEIPCIIRDLSDDQASEIQIVENLQRKDVNPMEEANSFNALLDRGFSIEEIGAKVGKPPSFVAQRVKLSNLIEGFQEFVYAGKMTLVLAGKVCRFDADTQKELYKEARVPKNWKTNKEFQLDNLWGLDSKGIELDRAAFKTEDPDLYPEAGACNKCPHNSASNKLLFPDLKNDRICHNPACFAIKSSRAYAKSIEDALGNKDLIFVSFSSYPDKEEKAKIKAVTDMGLPVVPGEKIQVLRSPDPIPSWDDFLKDKIGEEFFENAAGDECEFEELPKKDQSKYRAEWKTEYDEELAEYQKALLDYQQKLDSGSYLKAFVITGNWECESGQIINVAFKAGKKIEVPDDAPAELKEVAIQQEIQSIKEREKRNSELDREKVFLRSMEQLKTEYLTMSDQLHPEELHALAVLLVETSYKARNEFDKSNDYTRVKIFNRLSKGEISLDEINRLVRIALFDRLVNKNSADPNRFGDAAAMQNIANVFIPDYVNIFQTEQSEKAAKRKENMKKRIKALES